MPSIQMLILEKNLQPAVFGSLEDIRNTVGTEVVMRHIFKATTQQKGMMCERVQKCKLWSAVNDIYEGQPVDNGNSDDHDATVNVSLCTVSILFTFDAQS